MGLHLDLVMDQYVASHLSTLDIDGCRNKIEEHWRHRDVIITVQESNLLLGSHRQDYELKGVNRLINVIIFCFSFVGYESKGSKCYSTRFSSRIGSIIGSSMGEIERRDFTFGQSTMSHC
jgi:hypothetical protein